MQYLANTPTLAWAEWIRHQEIEDPADLEGVAAALLAVLIPAHWSDRDLQAVKMTMELVLVDQLKAQGALGLLAPTAAATPDVLSMCST